MDSLYLRFTFLLLLLEENSCSKKRYYQCTYHKELFFELFDKRDSEEMICWDSQLHDSTRILLTQKYNNYRREVARGTCPTCNIREKYQYMCEMKWHWILEKKAQELLQKRNFTQQMSSLSVNESYSGNTDELGYSLLESKFLEYASTSFLLDESVDIGQISYVTRLFNHLNEQNILHDWAKHFRRQFVTFFGCSIAVIKIIKSEPSAHTAIDEQIKDGDKILRIACVFASPIQNEFIRTKETHNHTPTQESCSTVNWSSQVAVDVKNGLCSFDDRADVMAVFIPCQIYYPHPYFVDVDMSCCPGDPPSYWNRYELLEESNHSHVLIHLADATKLEFALKSSDKTFNRLLSSATPSISDEVVLGDEISDLNPLDDSSYVEYEWQSGKKERAVELYRADPDKGIENTTSVYNLFDPKLYPPVFYPEPLPAKPEQQMVSLSPVYVVDPWDAKYCVVITLFYFIIFFTLCVLLSLMAKYYVEREYFKSR